MRKNTRLRLGRNYDAFSSRHLKPEWLNHALHPCPKWIYMPIHQTRVVNYSGAHRPYRSNKRTAVKIRAQQDTMLKATCCASGPPELLDYPLGGTRSKSLRSPSIPPPLQLCLCYTPSVHKVLNLRVRAALESCLPVLSNSPYLGTLLTGSSFRYASISPDAGRYARGDEDPHG